MHKSFKTKEILILANSRKQNGRCVAGIELSNGNPVAWVRPVSNREHGEVSVSEREYQDGTEPSLLEVVRVPLIRHLPNSYQTENWLLDADFYWECQSKVDIEQLEEYEDTLDLWLVDTVDTQFGLNDRVPLTEAESITNSLRLIHVEDLQYRVFVPGAAFGNPKRRVQASFTHGGTEYRLWVTDPAVTDDYSGKPNGTYPAGPAYMTISLGEAYDGYTYKLVAAVIPS